MGCKVGGSEECERTRQWHKRGKLEYRKSMVDYHYQRIGTARFWVKEAGDILWQGESQWIADLRWLGRKQRRTSVRNSGSSVAGLASAGGTRERLLFIINVRSNGVWKTSIA